MVSDAGFMLREIPPSESGVTVAMRGHSRPEGGYQLTNPDRPGHQVVSIRSRYASLNEIARLQILSLEPDNAVDIGSIARRSRQDVSGHTREEAA